MKLYFSFLLLLLFSLILHISSFEFFHHSFQVFLLTFSVPVLFVYFLKLDTINLSLLSIFMLFFLVYAYFSTYLGYYRPDGLFFLYFIFVLYVVFVFFEQYSLSVEIKKSNCKRLKNFWFPVFKEPVIGGIFLTSFIDSVYSYFEFCLKSLNVSGKEIVPYLIPYLIIIRPGSSIGGFLYQPNLNALLLNIGLLITVFWIVKQKNQKSLVELFVIYIFFAYAAAFTSSRAGLLAVLSVFLFIFIHKRFFKLDMSKKDMYVLITLFVVYITIFFFNKYSPLAKFSHQGLIGDNSVDERIMVWLATILLWLKHPFFGTGLETFKFLNNPYQIESCKILRFPSDIISNFTWAHNEPIQILEELGIFAFLSIIFIAIFYYIKVLKEEKNIENLLIPSLILVFIVQAGLSWPLRHPALLALFFVILALENKKVFFTLQGNLKNIFVVVLLAVAV